MLDSLWQDIRHGVRMLAKSPGFTTVAVVSVALGVGANAAMFSVADGLVLRPLPVPRASDVVTVQAVSPGIGFRSPNLSYPEYLDLKEQSRTLEGLVAYQFVVTSFAQRPNELVQRKAGMAVSGNLFEAMGLRPALGRGFRPDEDEVAGRNPVVILDHDEWTEQFGGDPGIVGREVRIGAVPFTIIGVAPRGFTGIDHDVHPAFYIPIAMSTSVLVGGRPDDLTRRAVRRFTVKGRLKTGSSLAEARTDMQQVGSNLARAFPDTNQDRSFTARTQLDAFLSRPQAIDGPIVFMLMTLALAVLAVACANVGGLLLSRAPVRAREIGLRLALGSGRARLVRQLVTEGLLIAVGGVMLGLGLASVILVAFQRVEFPTDIPLKLTFVLDTRALVVGIVAALLCAVLASLVPAWLATRTDLVSVLKGQEVSTKISRLWGRSTLVGGQVALSLVLLTISVFLYRVFAAELDEGPGYRTDHLLMSTFDPTLARYDDARTAGFYRALVERAKGLPGVRSVALTSAIPMKNDTIDFTPVAPEDFTFPPGSTNVRVLWARIDEGYFDAFDIGIVSGRAFTAGDASDSPAVAIVNETMARRYWPDQDPLGKRVRLDQRDGMQAEVVGVARDIKSMFIAIDPVEQLYVPWAQHPFPQNTLVLETEGPPAALTSSLRDVVRAIDPDMPVFGIRTMEDFYASRAVYVTNLLSGSVGAMGTMALVLAMVGLYGLVAYAASRRTREIGIRMAVGANPISVLRMVLRHGLVLSAAGIGVGLLASVATSGFLGGVFPGQGRIDLWTYALVVPALILVTLVATYLPARRASRVDPLVALRAE
jgi:putative ABC transport system permease protein